MGISMKNRGEEIGNCKLRGEWAEMYFMSCAAERGIHVSRPYGESTHFDFIVGDKGCLLRVQVKSTMSPKEPNGFGCAVWGSHSKLYEPNDFDFLAVLVIPLKVWYIIPAGLVIGKSKVFVFPGSPKSKYAPYKDAWHLLRTRPCALRGMIEEIQACADDAGLAWVTDERERLEAAAGG